MLQFSHKILFMFVLCLLNSRYDCVHDGVANGVEAGDGEALVDRFRDNISALKHALKQAAPLSC